MNVDSLPYLTALLAVSEDVRSRCRLHSDTVKMLTAEAITMALQGMQSNGRPPGMMHRPEAGDSIQSQSLQAAGISTLRAEAFRNRQFWGSFDHGNVVASGGVCRKERSHSLSQAVEISSSVSTLKVESPAIDGVIIFE